MEKAHWHLLTRHLKKTGEIKNGLTIPYLYGAYKHLGYDIDSIEDLLTLILNSPAAHVPVIERCDVIKFDVLQLEDPVFVNRYRKDEVRIPSTTGKNELVISYNTSLGKDVKKVAATLMARYQKPIDDHTFSWNQKEKRWIKFEEPDYKNIEAIA